MDENRGPGGVDTDHPWSTPSFCPVASHSTKAGDAQLFSRVCVEGFCASCEVQGSQGHESCAFRGGPLCIGRPRINGEGIAGSFPEGKDGGLKLSDISKNEQRRQHMASTGCNLLWICFGHDSQDAEFPVDWRNRNVWRAWCRHWRRHEAAGRKNHVSAVYGRFEDAITVSICIVDESRVAHMVQALTDHNVKRPCCPSTVWGLSI